MLENGLNPFQPSMAKILFGLTLEWQLTITIAPQETYDALQ